MNLENFPNLKPDSQELKDSCIVEIYDPKKISWNEIKEDILRVEISAFGEEKAFDEEMLQEAFENPDSIVIMTRDAKTNRIVGFTYAEPTVTAYPEEYPERETRTDTAYISDSAFEDLYQGHGLISPMMEELENQLVQRGFSFMERDSADSKRDESFNEETYAQKIRKNYGNRIVKEEFHDSEYGPQVFFRIKLRRSGKN